jgi:uncharacterized protein (DUF305 family)
MTWMTLPPSGDGHGEHDAATNEHDTPMPGLATAEQIDELRASTGVEAERRFLELMIAHHGGAIEMADAALARSTNGVVAAFAQSIVDSQTVEIALMEDLLAARS